MNKGVYRGQSIYDRNWAVGNLLVFPNTGRMKILVWNDADLDFDQVEVIPETVGQFTGVSDKYGKEIFEGDYIVLDNDVKKIFKVKDGVVRFGRGGFFVTEFDSLHSLDVLASWDGILRGKVIGNIHDNPNLSIEEYANGGN